MHEHAVLTDGLGWALFEYAVVLLLLAAGIGYAAALWTARRRRPWPIWRTTFWYAGLACAGAGLVGPVAEAAHSSFTGHMAVHLLIGMVAPLLLVMAAPVTVALLALPVPRARSLSWVLRTRAALILTHPAVAALLNIGGLWLLYTTDLYQLMHASALLHALVHAHIFLAGYLFTASLVGPDPRSHPTSMFLRSTVLIVFIAAHSILAKWLYASPPDGIALQDGQAGAQLMYYGGDLVDVTLIVLLFASWYRSTRPRESILGSRIRPDLR